MNIGNSSLLINIESIPLSGFLNLVYENIRITVKWAVVQEDLHTIYVHAKSHNTMYKIVNLEDITALTPLGVIKHHTNPH